jgi:tetratricopeptide (TPR) repeat protein
MRIETKLKLTVVFVSLFVVSCSNKETENVSQLPDSQWLYNQMVDKTISADTALVLAKRLNMQDTVQVFDVFLMGMAHQEMRHLDSAISAYYQVLRYDATWDHAHSKLSYIYMERGKPEKALYHAIKADSLAPSPSNKTRIADSYFQMDSLEKAIPLYETLISKGVGKKENLYHLAQALVLSGDTEKSLSVSEKLVSLFPEFERGWGVLALNYSLTNVNDKAIVNYKQSLQLVPDGDIAYQLARLYLEEDVEDSACFYYEEALRLESDIAGTQEIDTLFCVSSLQ